MASALGSSFFRSCFRRNQKAPAKNADPNTMVFCQVMFFQKTKAPARNADPNTTAFLLWKCDKFQPRCCEADFGSRIKILGYPLGRSASFFEIHLFRLVPGPGLKIDFFEKLSQVSKVAEMVAEKNMFTLLGPNCDQGGQTCCDADFGPLAL